MSQVLARDFLVTLGSCWLGGCILAIHKSCVSWFSALVYRTQCRVCVCVCGIFFGGGYFAVCNDATNTTVAVMNWMHFTDSESWWFRVYSSHQYPSFQPDLFWCPSSLGVGSVSHQCQIQSHTHPLTPGTNPHHLELHFKPATTVVTSVLLIQPAGNGSVYMRVYAFWVSETKKQIFHDCIIAVRALVLWEYSNCLCSSSAVGRRAELHY